MIPLWVRSLGRLLLLVGGAGSSRCPGATDSRLATPGPWEGLSAGSERGALVLSPTWPWSLLEEGAYDEYENDLGITAIALYDYQAGEKLLVGQKEGWGGAGLGASSNSSLKS